MSDTNFNSIPENEVPWVAKARSFIGVKEGTDDVQIVSFARSIGLSWVKTSATPWCAIFMGNILKQCNMPFLQTAVARNYTQYPRQTGKGSLLKQPCYGCIVVLYAGTNKNSINGHVAFCIGEDANNPNNIILLGGNQSDKVGINSFPKAKIVSCIWPNIAPKAERYNLPKLSVQKSKPVTTR